jgi:hypothetical protein
MFNFRDIIAKYSSPISLTVEVEGHYDYDHGGVWVPGVLTEVETTAAVMNLSTKELNTTVQYGEGGAYTRHDRKIYIYQPLKIGQVITHKTNLYKVSQEADYSDYTEGGLRIYYARRVSNEL